MSLAIVRFGAFMVCCLSSLALAQEPLRIIGSSEPQFEPARYAHLNLSPDQLAAAHELELAQFRFVTWAHFEYPAQLKSFDQQLAFAQAEVRSLQRRISEAGRVNVWVGGGNPLFEQLEDLNLALLAAQQRLDRIQYDRGLSLQHQALEYGLRQQAVEAAKMKLRLAK